MKKLLLGLLCTIALGAYANPADDLLNRIDKGAAAKFKTILVKSDKDFFEIDQTGNGKNTTAPNLPAQTILSSSEATLGSILPWVSTGI